jgi:aldehyde:ferredoxin oxidoreductase
VDLCALRYSAAITRTHTISTLRPQHSRKHECKGRAEWLSESAAAESGYDALRVCNWSEIGYAVKSLEKCLHCSLCTARQISRAGK